MRAELSLLALTPLLVVITLLMVNIWYGHLRCLLAHNC